MFTTRLHVAPALLSLGVFALLSMSLFGVFHMGMSMSSDGTMSDCTGMPGMNVCPMTPFEHASFMYDSLSNILPQQDSLLALILSMSFFVATGAMWFRQLLVPPDRLRSIGYFYRRKQFAIPQLFQELFSTGILNPKPF